MHISHNHASAAVLAYALALGGAMPAYAQDAGQNASEATSSAPVSGGDIIVTAQKREQKLQDVGVAITAVTGDSLRKMGISSTQDLSKAVPGVTLDSVQSGGNGAQLVVRGVSQSDFSAFQESPNSIYVDDIYLSTPNAAAFTLYDLDRVEVLRGPQGTLFGRASSGGLVNFLSKRPTYKWQGYAEVGYSSYNDTYAEAAGGGPLSDSVRFRLSGRREVGDGWWHNDNPGNKNAIATDFVGLRGQLEADLSDTLTGRVSVSYDKNIDHADGTYRPASFYFVNGQPTPLPANVDAYGTGPGNDRYGYRDTDGRQQSGSFNSVGYVANKRFSPSLYLTWDRSPVTITSITNYTRFSYRYNEDCDGGPVDACQNPQQMTQNQFSEEFRANGKVGALAYTLGVYYLHTSYDFATRYVIPVLQGTDFAFEDTNTIHQNLDSIAAFGQLEYNFTDKLKLTAGARFTHDRKKFSSQVAYNELGNGYSGGTGSTVYNPPFVFYDFSPSTVGGLAIAKNDLWSGKIQLDYKPVSNILLYAGVSRGSKGAGFNGNLSGGLSYAETPFRSEYLIDYEGGAKMQLFDRRVTLNLSAFNYDYHHFQAYAFFGLQGVIGNVDGYFRGGELEFDATPVRTVNLRLGVSYLTSKLRDVPTNYNGVRDEQGVNAPRWTVKGSISKDLQLGPDLLTINWSGDYVGDRYSSTDNNAATFVKGSFLHSARVTYHLQSQDLDISAFINNISNAARQVFAFDLVSGNGNVLQSYAKPRWIGGSIRKTF